MKKHSLYLITILATFILIILFISCEKHKIVFIQTVFNGESIRHRAQTCNLHDSIFLDLPEMIVFQAGYTETTNNYAFSMNSFYKLSIKVPSFPLTNQVFNVEYSTGSPSPGKIIIQIDNLYAGGTYIAYNGVASFTYNGLTTGYLRYCNVLFKNKNGNGSYNGTGYIYVDF